MSDLGVPVWLAAWGLTVLVPLAAVTSVLLATLSALLERSGPIRLRHWAEGASEGLRRLYDEPARFEAFRFVVSLTAKVMPLVVVGLLWAVLAERGTASGWWLSPVLVAALLCAVEWVNRRLVELHAEGALKLLTWPLRGIHALARPVLWMFTPMVAVAEDSEEEEEDEASEEEIDAFLYVGRREGILEPEEEELVRSIVDFGDAQVKSVMTPRVEIRSMPASATLEELAKAFFESKHSRLPLHGESVDEIVGILHIRDLFQAIHDGVETDAVALANPPHYVPETKPLPELLEELQKLRQQMAIVVDEYGGVAGLVTVEDLVEEIVGEIADEHERPRRHRQRLDADRWRLRGRVALEDLGEIFGLDLDEEPYETVSGLICGQLGHVPRAGEVIEAHGLSFTVEEADERRVITVSVGRAVAEEVREAGA